MTLFQIRSEILALKGDIKLIISLSKNQDTIDRWSAKIQIEIDKLEELIKNGEFLSHSEMYGWE